MILERGDHSGKDNLGDNGNENPHKESVPTQDFENPLSPNSNFVMENEEQADQNDCALPNSSLQDHDQQNVLVAKKQSCAKFQFERNAQLSAEQAELYFLN